MLCKARMFWTVVKAMMCCLAMGAMMLSGAFSGVPSIDSRRDNSWLFSGQSEEVVGMGAPILGASYNRLSGG